MNGSFSLKCTLGVFHALAFVADFPSVAPEFYQRTHRVRLKNLGTTDKKSSHKIKYKKIPRVHQNMLPGSAGAQTSSLYLRVQLTVMIQTSRKGRRR